MRKLFLAFSALILFLLVGAVALIYATRDQILLDQARRQFAKLAPTKIELASLHTNLLGAFELTLEGLKLSQEGNALELRELKVRTPLSIWGLYSAYKAGIEIPLQMNMNGAVATLASAPSPQSSPKKISPWPSSFSLPALSPVPVQAEISFQDFELRGPFGIKKAQGKLEVRASQNALETKSNFKAMATLPGAEATLPVSLDFKITGTRKALKLQSFTMQAAGLDASGSGDLTLEPLEGKFRVNAEAADLSRLALRPEDRAALGLTAQPSGSFSLKANAIASSQGLLLAKGTLNLVKVGLPVKAPEKTVFSRLMEGSRVEGEISLGLELPFSVEAQWPLGQTPMKLEGNAHASIDLTNSAVEKKGVLRKPKGIPMNAELRASLGEKGVIVESLNARFHTLELNGSAELLQPLGNTVVATFKTQTGSLTGFPELLPALLEANANGTKLSDAQGSISAEGRVRFLAATPAQSFVELKALSLRGVRLPVRFENETVKANGILLASMNGAGKYDAGALDVAQSSGNIDMTGMSLILPGKLEKKKGRKLLLAFDAKGNPSKLILKKASLSSTGLDASLSGNIVSNTKGKILLELKMNWATELSALMEYLPALPMKISGGNLSGGVNLVGVWLTEGGIEKSPILLSGNILGKVGSIEMPEAAPSKSKEPPAPLFPDWLLARKARIAYKLELAQFTRGKLAVSGIAAHGTLNSGSFLADVTDAKAFGGKITLKQVTGNALTEKLPVSGSVFVEGMNLSALAGYVDPTYTEIVKGKLKADANFQVPNLRSEQLLETATAVGKAEISNGYLSTASIDSMVNAKLAGIPGIGDKAKLNSGGMAADMRTDFSFANSTATLKNFFATTPKKDEVRLNGTMNLAFDCDMAGEAALVSAPVQGAVREANSDAQGRLVVPIRFRGNLKNPSIDIASETIQSMLGKTAKYEANKLKDKALNEGKKKLEDEAKNAAGDLLKGLFKKK